MPLQTARAGRSPSLMTIPLAALAALAGLPVWVTVVVVIVTLATTTVETTLPVVVTQIVRLRRHEQSRPVAREHTAGTHRPESWPYVAGACGQHPRWPALSQHRPRTARGQGARRRRRSPRRR